jgi:hypothetical protein
VFKLTCPSLPDFHAVTASQFGHEFLIGCMDSEYDGGSWSCVDLLSGSYLIGVHSRTVTVYNSGFFKQNVRSGKKLAYITPVFSILGELP